MRYWIPVATLLLSATAVQAQDRGEEGAYMGFGVGLARYEQRALGVSFSDTASAYRIFGGYRFNENFAVEGSWGATSDLKDNVLGADVKSDFDVVSVRALGVLPLDRISVFGGIGYYDADVKMSVANVSVSDSDDGATLIGGVQFKLSRVSLRAEYEWFDTDSNVDASTFGVGLLFRF